MRRIIIADQSRPCPPFMFAHGHTKNSVVHAVYTELAHMSYTPLCHWKQRYPAAFNHEVTAFPSVSAASTFNEDVARKFCAECRWLLPASHMHEVVSTFMMDCDAARG